MEKMADQHERYEKEEARAKAEDPNSVNRSLEDILGAAHELAILRYQPVGFSQVRFVWTPMFIKSLDPGGAALDGWAVTAEYLISGPQDRLISGPGEWYGNISGAGRTMRDAAQQLLRGLLEACSAIQSRQDRAVQTARRALTELEV